MATVAVIRFPPPPPTRAKLRPTNNKHGQVLGNTPHVLDLSYLVPKTQIELSSSPKTPTSSRNPFRMHSRSKSVPKIDMDTVRASARSPHSITSRAFSTSRTSSVRIRVKTHGLAWRSPYTAQHPPLLQPSVPNHPRSRKPQLETILRSPPFDQTTGSYEPSSLSIPSDTAMRRKKMRMLRKMLREGVPTDLVFALSPEESDSKEDSRLFSTSISTMSLEWLLVDTPLPYKPLPFEPSSPVVPEPEPTPTASTPRDTNPKECSRPSTGAKPLESIADSTNESRPDSLTCIAVSASAGVNALGKSRRFVKNDVHMDQIRTVWGGFA
ncbi:hypothetical protein L226DRAFT_547705 [Lentinus tigrinus ALCF2SS1-7]|uniref:uncharacterized protein n=1 Tax=Lentinus tigrinus ALCF2SS1-7 TaxID=1328758 RepID=UPI0011661C10|nr:hypothetical protein L226DRAFT_547705 [Lentinus tigrinus ALCF2SS1-7]